MDFARAVEIMRWNYMSADKHSESFEALQTLENMVLSQPATNKPMVAETAQISPCEHEWIQACTQASCRKCGIVTDD